MRALPAHLTRAVERGGRDLTVLVLRFGALGDVLRAVPAVRLLRRGLPEARIVWAVEDRWAVVLEAHPDVDLLLRFPRAKWNALVRGALPRPGLRSALREWRTALREPAPDVALDFHGNLRSGISARLSGARIRIGHAGHQQKEGNRWLTTHRVAAGDRRVSRVERNVELVRALGLADAPLPGAGIVIPDAAGRAARAAVESRAADFNARRPGAGADGGGDGGVTGYAVIAAGVSRRQSYKKPDPSLLAAAAIRLREHRIASLVVYGPGEEDDARRVVEAGEGAALLAPPTDLPVLAALLRDARLFVGGDTGPLHLACAVGCPVLGLYGPTDPRVNAPWGVPHVALSPPGRRYTGRKAEDRQGGFEGLTAAAVREAVERLLDRDA